MSVLIGEQIVFGISISSWTGLAGTIWVYTALLLKFGCIVNLSCSARRAIFFIALCLFVVPFGDSSWVIYLRGFLGDLSVATLMVATIVIITSLKTEVIQYPDAGVRRDQFYMLILLMAVLLYPSALGLGRWDAYQLGYNNPYFEWTLLMVGCLALVLRNYFVAIWISLTLLSYLLSLYESSNLWDYLLDPVITLMAIVNRVQWCCSIGYRLSESSA